MKALACLVGAASGGVRWASAIGTALICLGAAGCARFDSPPEPVLTGTTDGLLKDPKQPLVVDFGEPVKQETLAIAVAPFIVDAEGDLGDEDDDPNTDFDGTTYYERIPGYGDVSGTGVFGEKSASFSIQTDQVLPVGPRLVIVVEPGLSDLGGVVTVARRRLLFGFDAAVVCNAPTQFPSGYAFFLASVKEPIGTQVQLFASLVVDPDTGKFIGQFTNADRNPDPNRCPSPCDADQVCRLLPSPACVTQSEQAGTVAEWSDYVPNNAAPAGYSFTATGCVVDQPDGTLTFVTSPVDVDVTQPVVTLRNARLNASFKLTGSALQATGSFAADDVLIGSASSGAASGNLTGLLLTKKQAPPGIPDPPASN